MTKMEMINRMILLNIIRECDRNYWLNHSNDYIMEVYIKVVPIKLESITKEK